jgi:hypothetical protein
MHSWKRLSKSASQDEIRLAKQEKAKRLLQRQRLERARRRKEIQLEKLSEQVDLPGEHVLEAEDVVLSKANLLPVPYGEHTLEALNRFTVDCGETRLENTGEVRPMPNKRFLELTNEAWLGCTHTGTHSLYWKPRRMIVSWQAAVFDVWDLMQFPGDVLVAALKYEGKKGAKAFVWRRWFVYERLRRRFPEWNLPPSKPEGDVVKGELKSVTFPNGAKVEAVNSDPSSFRGGGARRVWTEELNEYPQVELVWKEACLLTQGPPGEIGGCAFAIVNAGTNEEYQAIKDRGDNPVVDSDLEGFSTWTSKTGVLIVDLRYWADPEKTAEWAIEASKGIPSLQWQIEMEKNEDLYDGEPVFPDFLYDQHAPLAFRDSFMPARPRSRFIGAWDCGQTKQPAFVLLQVLPNGQILFMFELVSNVPMPMRLFAPAVRDLLETRLPGRWSEVRHVGDPTGGTKLTSWATGKTEEYSAFDVARLTANFVIEPSINNPTIRRDAVHWLLLGWVDQTATDPSDWLPRSFFCEKGCPVLVKGMKGAYQWQITKLKNGTVYREPRKDFFSHVNDAAQYGAIEAYRLINGEIPSGGRYADW